MHSICDFVFECHLVDDEHFCARDKSYDDCPTGCSCLVHSEEISMMLTGSHQRPLVISIRNCQKGTFKTCICFIRAMRNILIQNMTDFEDQWRIKFFACYKRFQWWTICTQKSFETLFVYLLSKSMVYKMKHIDQSLSGCIDWSTFYCHVHHWIRLEQY